MKCNKEQKASLQSQIALTSYVAYPASNSADVKRDIQRNVSDTCTSQWFGSGCCSLHVFVTPGTGDHSALFAHTTKRILFKLYLSKLGSAICLKMCYLASVKELSAKFSVCNSLQIFFNVRT